MSLTLQQTQAYIDAVAAQSAASDALSDAEDATSAAFDLKNNAEIAMNDADDLVDVNLLLTHFKTLEIH